MPKATNNPLLNGMSGMLGNNIVFRQVNGETIMSNRPKKRETLTAHQEKSKARLTIGASYARRQMEIPYIKALYKQGVTKKLTNAYTVALTDFLTAPSIGHVDVSRYDGSIGSVIEIEAHDDFEVASVTVSLYDAVNKLIESGDATRSIRGTWTYETTKLNADVTGSRIVVKVMDRPGNAVSREVVIA